MECNTNEQPWKDYYLGMGRIRQMSFKLGFRNLLSDSDVSHSHHGEVSLGVFPPLV